MNAEEKQELIEHAKSWIANADAARDELPFGFDEDTEKEISLIKIALAALTAQPVKLPDNVQCKGAPQFVWLQVSCDTGNPSEWPEHPEAGVTWHTEQIHSDDVLYIRANNDEVPK